MRLETIIDRLNENLYEENANLTKVVELLKELTEVEAKRALVNTAKVGKDVNDIVGQLVDLGI